MQNRRTLLKQLAASGAVAVVSAVNASSSLAANHSGRRRLFTMDLRGGSIGVDANQVQSISLAAKHGFESVTPDPYYAASLDEAGRRQLVDTLQQNHLAWGSAGMPVEFRKDEQTFQDGLKAFPAQAKAMQDCGVTRFGTWLRPNHDELTYVQNFKQHARRLRECAKVVSDHDQRFGLEYVGPKTLWASARHSFIHSLSETKDLLAEINQSSMGFVLDSWHWYTAHETVDDLKTLTNKDIVACDLNDAPSGIEIDQQIDNQRELPSATGVIDLQSFLSTLVELGYDGPIRSEPFNAKLNAMNNDTACAATAAAMKKAFGLIGG